MKKLFKILLKVVKWYAILDLLAWAYIGAGCYLDRCRRYNTRSPLKVCEAAFDAAGSGWKWLLNRIRNGF